MTKSEFLADSDVGALARWVADRFERESGWTHTYSDRTTEVRWSCIGLADAWQQYRWHGKDWATTKDELDSYRHALRGAVAAGDGEAAHATCTSVLRWVGVAATNAAELTTRKATLIAELQHLARVLTGDRTPGVEDMFRDPNDAASECRLNAGFVKIYSVLLDSCVIYDGRVGAALGLLARQYCIAVGCAEVPPIFFGSPGARQRNRPTRGAGRIAIRARRH